MFLGHKISKEGIAPPDDRVKAIEHYPAPQNIKETRRLLGTFQWFSKYIPNFSTVSHPIRQLLKAGRKFQWGKEQDAALTKLKESLINSTVLAFPRFDLDFRLGVDTCCRGIGYCLYQVYPEHEFPPNTPEKDRIRIIRFGSKALSKWQHSYGPTKLELLGLVTSVLDCASYIRGKHCIIECDHQALKPIYQKKLKGAIYERWLAILQQFSKLFERMQLCTLKK